MAHYAEVINGIVQRVVVVSNDVTIIDGVEDEQAGIDHLDAILPTDGSWVQTSYNGNLRHNYAGVGCLWDGTGFAASQPYGSWTLDADYQWQPPTPMPDDGTLYEWDEDTTSWRVSTFPAMPEDPPTAKVTRKVAAGSAAHQASLDGGGTAEEAQTAYDTAYAATD